MGRIPNPLYEELAYIESTGTQYIDTGIMASQMASLNYEIDFQLPTTSQSGYASMGCGNWGSSGWYGNILSFGSYHSGIMTRINSTGDTKLGDKDTNRHKLIIDTTNSVAIYDGVSNNITVSSTTGIGSLLLFASSSLNGSTPYNSSYCKCRIYSLKIGTLRDFVPCRRKDTGVIGLLDLVNYDFYPNNGTGTFNYGLLVESEVSPLNSGIVSGTGTYLPGDNVTLTATANSGYEFEKWELNDYYLLTAIESTGTQFIKPGITIGNDIKVIADFRYEEISQSRLFGATNGSLYYQFGTNPPDFIGQPGIGGSYQTILADTDRHTVILDALTGLFQLDDRQYNLQSTTNSNNRELYIFARNTQGTPDNYAKARLYSLKIYKNNVLVRDFIPVMQKGTIEFGLLDLVEMKFYKNSGTGQFLAYESGTEEDVSITDNPLSLPNLQNSFELTAYFKSIANCRYKVNGTWKNGTMYIKENGTWKSGTPKIKVNGAWKEGG